MTAKTKKIFLISAKLIIALILLGWVLSQVHWRDYVVSRTDGKSYSVYDGVDSDVLLVNQAGRWWKQPVERPVSDFEPVSSSQGVIRPGFATTLKHIDILLLVCAVLAFSISIIIIAIRWRLLLGIQDIKIRLWEVIRLTFLGQFFNVVVPGTVGGDLIKAYYASRHTTKKPAVLVSIFLDRVLGFTELSILATVMLAAVVLSGVETLDNLQAPAVSVAVIILVVIGMLTFLFSERFRSLLHLEKLYQRLPIAHHIAAAGDAVRLYRQRIGDLFKAILITFGAHVLFVGSVALVGASLSLDTPWYNYLVFVPLIYILGAVPITPGGVGLIEQFYLVFFVSAICGPSEVLALALLARLVPIISGLPGGIVAITGTKHPKTSDMEAQLGISEDSSPN